MKRKEPCGVWIASENRFCTNENFCYRRCNLHYFALRKSADGDLKKSIWYSLKLMNPEQRKKALDTLDSVQKQRDPWEYRNDVGEQELMAEQERIAAQERAEHDATPTEKA